MDLMNELGISFKASYLVQGNQLERCKTSVDLNVNNIELQIRSDGKDSNISSLSKVYSGNIIFHLPAINPDLSNLKIVNELTRNIVNNNIHMVTINASNLSLDLFEWSTLEEQKKYFLNIVTAISTLASNKIEVAIENMKTDNVDSMFGNNISQITDIIVYSRKLLVSDFGFSKEEAEKYIGLCLNIDNIDVNNNRENILNYFELFNTSIKVIKINNLNYINDLLDILLSKNYNIPLLLQTSSELEEIKNEFNKLKKVISDKIGIKIKPIKKQSKNVSDNKGLSNILIISMILLTIIIVYLMFIIKLKS